MKEKAKIDKRKNAADTEFPAKRLAKKEREGYNTNEYCIKVLHIKTYIRKGSNKAEKTDRCCISGIGFDFPEWNG